MSLKIALIIMSTIAVSFITAQPKLLFVEGNIGVGKSTFLHVIQKHLDVVTISEPCDEWQDIAGSGHNLLDAFYKDGRRWACTFQLYAFISRIKKQQAYAHLGGAVHIIERSWFSDRYCFAQNAVLLGIMTQMEWCLYLDMWDWYVHQAGTPIGFIYLRANPEICYDRMQKRARSEEAVVPLEYLQMLHDRHEEWLIDRKYKADCFAHLPVLVLDGSADFKNDEEVQKKFMYQILDFLRIHESIIL